MNTSFRHETIIANVENTGINTDVHYITDNRKSWVIHVKGFLAPYDSDAIDKLWNLHPQDRRSISIYGRDVLLPRYIENYGIDYKFSGKMFRGVVPPPSLQELIERLQPLVAGESKTMLNNCLVNWYKDGNHYIGPHCDNEDKLYTCSPVISLSIGATRTFRLTAKPSVKIPTTNVDLKIQHGDLLVMGGLTQFTHYHSVPKTTKRTDRRISITMRCMRV